MAIGYEFMILVIDKTNIEICLMHNIIIIIAMSTISEHNLENVKFGSTYVKCQKCFYVENCYIIITNLT